MSNSSAFSEAIRGEFPMKSPTSKNMRLVVNVRRVVVVTAFVSTVSGLKFTSQNH